MAGNGGEPREKAIGMNSRNNRLELDTLQTWLWDAACVIRGPIDAPKFKDYILHTY